MELYREKLLLSSWYSHLGFAFVHPRVPLLVGCALLVCLVGGCLNCAPVALALLVGLLGKLRSPHAGAIDVPQSYLIRSIWPTALLNLNDLWLSFCDTSFKPNI